MLEKISISTHSRNELVDITDEVRSIVRRSKIKDGLCIVFAPHTTAGITINEDADPSVRADILKALNMLIPENAKYNHTEGNSPAHIKSSLVGHSVSICIENNELTLGRWQGIYFCEFDGPRMREACIKIV